MSRSQATPASSQIITMTRMLEEKDDEIERLRAELETERMRRTACGVVALANTPDSATKARDMPPEWRSASCDAVARMVDENMRLRAELDVLRRHDQ